MKLLAFTFFLMLMMTEMFYAQNPMPNIEPGVSQTLAVWRAAHYRDVRYKLNITLEKGAPSMKGTIEITVNLPESEWSAKREGTTDSSFKILKSAPTIILDWRKIRGKENLSTVSNVSVNGRRVRLNPDSNQIGVIVEGREEQSYFEFNEHLVFQDGVKTGENVIKLDFTSPIATSGAAVTRYTDKEDGAEYVYSLFVPSDASTAFPVFDQPDLKARFTLSLGVENNWRAVSNTKIASRTNLDCRQGALCGTIYNFEETKPISTYVFAFAAGEFAEFKDESDVGPVKTPPVGSTRIYEPLPNPNASKIYVRKSQAEKFRQHEKEVFRLNREAVKNLESYFDYRFPFPKYDLVLIPEFPFGGMEHAGATFLREASIIFPSEPTKNDYISRANLIFHEAAHQWFGDTVTMKWFDDLWLKEGFAEFMAYKTLEKVMPEYNAWKAFYERNKPLAYLTDVTKGTTPVYQEIPNLSAAKSAYGNIVYRKAPSFLKQAEFFLGEAKFQTAVRAFLKKHEFSNAEWTDLVKEFETASGFGQDSLKEWSETWIRQRGLGKMSVRTSEIYASDGSGSTVYYELRQENVPDFRTGKLWSQTLKFFVITADNQKLIFNFTYGGANVGGQTDGGLYQGIEINNDNYLTGKLSRKESLTNKQKPVFIFPNYQDYGYGIFLLDDKSRDYVLKNIGTEKDDFLRSMMWGTLWDSVREAELNPKDYVELAIKNIAVEQDESTIQAILNRVGTALNYYLPDAQRDALAARLEAVLTERIANAQTPGQRITFYRAYLNLASSAQAQRNLKDILTGKSKLAVFQLRTKDKFDLVTRLLILGEKDAPALLANLEKTETSDDAKRYAYAARAGIGTQDAKAKYFKDFMTNKEISESWIEAAFVPFNSSRHAGLTLPFLETALAELPNLKKTRKIFFVNGWLGAFIGGQKSADALATVNKFLADNPNLDKDLRLKILENADNLERAVKIRAKYGK